MASGGINDKDVETLTGFFDQLELSLDGGDYFVDKLFFVHQTFESHDFSLVWAHDDFTIPQDIIKIAKTAVGCLLLSNFCTIENKLYRGYFQCHAKVMELEVKPLSDARKVVLWSRYGCALEDVGNLEIVKAGFEVLLSYIQTKAAHQVLYRKLFNLLRVNIFSSNLLY